MSKRLFSAHERKTGGIVLTRVLATLALVGLFASAAAAGGINPFGRDDFSLGDGDLDIIQHTTDPYYKDETVPLGTVRGWTNPKTGNGGTAILVSRFKYKDMPCRRIQHDIKLVSVADPFRFIIDRCQVADGSWKML